MEAKGRSIGHRSSPGPWAHRGVGLGWMWSGDPVLVGTISCIMNPWSSPRHNHADKCGTPITSLLFTASTGPAG
jgi:hypothetical protein